MKRIKQFNIIYNNKSKIKINAKKVKLALGLCYPFIKWIEIKEIKK